jgi:hypothetical protein
MNTWVAVGSDRIGSDRIRLVRLMVLVELLVAVIASLESAVVTLVGFGSIGATVLTVAVAGTLAWQLRALGRGRVSRTLRGCQWLFLVVALIDLGLRIVLSGAALPLVPLLVRFVVPITVLRAARP